LCRGACAALRFLGGMVAGGVGLLCAAQGTEKLTTRSFEVGGRERTALVAAPSTGEALAPLVFVFHGHGGSSRQAARSFQLHEHWPAAWVVHPQGLPTPGAITDPKGRRAGWQMKVGDQGDRDLAFFDAMLAAMLAEGRVDPRRVYATGHSNGGAFTYLLWAERGAVFAALAPSSAVLPLPATHYAPLPVLHLGSEQDELVKWSWQERMVDLVLKVNGGGPQGSPSLGLTLYPPQDSARGAETALWLHDGGHRLPAEAGAEVAKFFLRHATLTP
jgi:polyhydroxybutyrate depolymerase